MTLEIQGLAWNSHNNVTGLNLTTHLLFVCKNDLRVLSPLSKISKWYRGSLFLLNYKSTNFLKATGLNFLIIIIKRFVCYKIFHVVYIVHVYHRNTFCFIYLIWHLKQTARRHEIYKSKTGNVTLYALSRTWITYNIVVKTAVYSIPLNVIL
jgi:hypothetical protein